MIKVLNYIKISQKCLTLNKIELSRGINFQKFQNKIKMVFSVTIDLRPFLYVIKCNFYFICCKFVNDKMAIVFNLKIKYILSFIQTKIVYIGILFKFKNIDHGFKHSWRQFATLSRDFFQDSLSRFTTISMVWIDCTLSADYYNIN